MLDKTETAMQLRQAITWVATLTTDTPREAGHPEQHLLEQDAQEVLDSDLKDQIGYILYHSRAMQLLSEGQLYDMLEDSRARNVDTGITGLLCYNQGEIVQLLEGPRHAVDKLYATIRRDIRHHHVVCLADGISPVRWFPDWRMAFVQPNSEELYWVINYIEARRNNLVLPIIPIADPLLLTLLQAFSTTKTDLSSRRQLTSES